MHPIPQEKFMLALSAYQKNKFQDARDLCHHFLQENPDHAACLHLLGVVESRLGNIVEAETLIRKSLAFNPNFPEMHYNFARVLVARGKYAEAISECQSTLRLKPGHVDVWRVLGDACKLSQQLVEAVKAYEQALRSKNDSPDIYNSLGAVFCEQRKLEEAVACFKQALQLRPDFVEAINNLGVACLEFEKLSEAEKYLREAVARKPDYTEALTNLGNVLRVQGLEAEAIQYYERALTLKPDNIEARNNLGLVLLHTSLDFDAAASCFKQILLQDPQHVSALTHLGTILYHQGLFAESVKCYEQALFSQPDDLQAQNNLGNALRALGRLPESIEAYRCVLAARPDEPESRHNMALALLMSGRFQEGWRAYESRWRTTHLKMADRHFSQRQWTGEEAVGRVLLIHAEQGFGDTIQFCRYASLAAVRGMHVILEVQPQLTRLMKSLPGVQRVVACGEPLPDFDVHCPMMSLPHSFGTEEDTIPSEKKYLSVPEEEAKLWKKRLDQSVKLKVGLAWAGNSRLFSSDLAAADRRRSMDFATLLPLFDVSNIEFYSLQKESTQLPVEPKIVNLMSQCHDFYDTAALIANLDLVISVDTAVAHLAAALGKPVWLMNRYDSCWRWFLDREDSPWYPTLRLFRQAAPGDWVAVVARVREALSDWNMREQGNYQNK